MESAVDRNTKICNMGEFSERGKLTGLRLKNPRYLCFLNTALNSVVSNAKLRERIFQREYLIEWGKEVLSLHEPNYFKGKFNSENEVIEGLTALRFKNVGCTESHEM